MDPPPVLKLIVKNADGTLADVRYVGALRKSPRSRYTGTAELGSTDLLCPKDVVRSGKTKDRGRFHDGAGSRTGDVLLLRACLVLQLH